MLNVLSLLMYLFHVVCQEVLYRPVVQGRYKRGRESAEVSERRRGPERSTSPHGRRRGWGDYAEVRVPEEIPSQGHQDFTVRFKFSEVKNSLWITALNVLSCLTNPGVKLSFSIFLPVQTPTQWTTRTHVWLSDTWPPWGRLHRALIFIYHRQEDSFKVNMSVYDYVVLAVPNLFFSFCLLYRFWECWVRVPSQSELKPWSVCLKS